MSLQHDAEFAKCLIQKRADLDDQARKFASTYMELRGNLRQRYPGLSWPEEAPTPERWFAQVNELNGAQPSTSPCLVELHIPELWGAWKPKSQGNVTQFIESLNKKAASILVLRKSIEEESDPDFVPPPQGEKEGIDDMLRRIVPSDTISALEEARAGATPAYGSSEAAAYQTKALSILAQKPEVFSQLLQMTQPIAQQLAAQFMHKGKLVRK
jgi:hypothetical protein